ncbi:MAG: VPLPA-CTERM sorting domain-containing protein [Pseudomonadota bacterium]
MIRTLLRAAAVATASLFVALPASAATMNIVGGITEIEVTADLGALGLLPSVFGTAGFDPSTATLSFPITGGTSSSSGLIIEHDGGGVALTSVATFQSATVGNFVIDTAQATVFGNVNGGSAFAPLFDFGTIDSSGIQLNISSDLAAALTAVFGAPDLAGAEFGIANTSPDTAPIPLPAAGWMLLAGMGGLAVLRRRSRAA